MKVYKNLFIAAAFALSSVAVTTPVFAEEASGEKQFSDSGSMQLTYEVVAPPQSTSVPVTPVRSSSVGTGVSASPALAGSATFLTATGAMLVALVAKHKNDQDDSQEGSGHEA